MKRLRQEKLNSLLKEVISEVIQKDLWNPQVAKIVSVTQVDISPDLHYAKVFVSVLGSDEERNRTLEALQTSAGFIGSHASKKITIRYFPSLTFKLDTSVDEHIRIEKILGEINQERLLRTEHDNNERDSQD